MFPGTLQFIHQTGTKDKEWVTKEYQTLGIKAECNDFFHDMASIYQQADLAISRAGATTLAELSVSGIPALLIPYPFAADNHQEINANHYVQGGGAFLYREDKLSGKLLAEQAASLLNNPLKLRSMADTMKSLGKPDATRGIVEQCFRLIKLPKSDQSYNQI